MAKRFKGFTRVGSMTVRGTFYRVVAANGVEVCLWAKMMPMLVMPEQYWFNYRAVGSILGTAPDGSQEMHTRGAVSPLNFSQEDVETDDFDGEELLDRYFDPRSGSSFSGDDGDAPVDLGLASQTTGARSALWGTKELWSGTVTLGLPDKAVFSDANQITYIDRYTRKGSFKDKDLDLMMPHAVAMGGNCDAIATQGDWSTALTGDAGGMNDLYKDILDNVGFQATGGVAAGKTNIPSALYNYINAGFRSGVTDIDQAMHTRVQGTVTCGVYDVDPSRQHLSSYR